MIKLKKEPNKKVKELEGKIKKIKTSIDKLSQSSSNRLWKYKKVSDKKHVKKEISYCLKCRKPTSVKEIHEALTLVNLIPQQSSKCKTRNAR